MTYQPYPTAGGGANQMAERPAQPQSIRTAVWLMWGGAALGVLGLIFTLAFLGRLKRAIYKAEVKANATRASNGKAVLTAAQMHTAQNFVVTLVVVVLVIGVLLWVWMAMVNGRGRGWARIVASILFGLNTIYLIFAASRATTTAIFVALSWLIGLVALIMLWRKESSDYINPRVQ
jgi:hypothetical protein